MKKIEFTKELKGHEILLINGGHDGWAYRAGEAAAKLFKVGLAVLSIVLTRGRR